MRFENEHKEKKLYYVDNSKWFWAGTDHAWSDEPVRRKHSNRLWKPDAFGKVGPKEPLLKT